MDGKTVLRKSLAALQTALHAARVAQAAGDPRPSLDLAVKMWGVIPEGVTRTVYGYYANSDRGKPLRCYAGSADLT